MAPNENAWGGVSQFDWVPTLQNVLGGDPGDIDPNRINGARWVTLDASLTGTTEHRSHRPWENARPLDPKHSGWNYFTIYRAIKVGDGWAFQVIRAHFDFYEPGGDQNNVSPARQSQLLVGLSDKVIGGIHNNAVLDSSTFTTASDLLYNVVTWLRDNSEPTVTSLTNQIDQDASGFKGTAAEVFMWALNDLRTGIHDLQTIVTDPTNWITLLDDSATAINNFKIAMENAWAEFKKYQFYDPNWLLAAVIQSIASQVDSNWKSSGSSHPGSPFAAWNFDFSALGLGTYDLSNASGWDQLDLAMKVTWADKHSNLENAAHSATQALITSFGQLWSSLGRGVRPILHLPPPDGADDPTKDPNDPGGDGGGGGSDINLDDIFGHGGGNGGGDGGGGGGGSNINLDDIFGHGGGNGGGGGDGGGDGGGGGGSDINLDDIFRRGGGNGDNGNQPPDFGSGGSGSGGFNFPDGTGFGGSGGPGSNTQLFNNDGPLSNGTSGGSGFDPANFTGTGSDDRGSGFGGTGFEGDDFPGSGGPTGSSGFSGFAVPGIGSGFTFPGSGSGGSGGGPGGSNRLAGGASGLDGLLGRSGSELGGLEPAELPDEHGGVMLGPLGASPPGYTGPDSLEDILRGEGLDTAAATAGGGGGGFEAGGGLGGGSGAGGTGWTAGPDGTATANGITLDAPGSGTGITGGTTTGATTPAPTAGYPPMMPPMGGMGGMGGLGRGDNEKERERTTWLAEDEKVWGTDPDCGPAVIGADDDAVTPTGTPGTTRPATPRPRPHQPTHTTTRARQ